MGGCWEVGTSYATWCGTMVKSGENLREVVGSIPDDWTFARQPDDVCGKSGNAKKPEKRRNRKIGANTRERKDTRKTKRTYKCIWEKKKAKKGRKENSKRNYVRYTGGEKSENYQSRQHKAGRVSSVYFVCLYTNRVYIGKVRPQHPVVMSAS